MNLFNIITKKKGASQHMSYITKELIREMNKCLITRLKDSNTINFSNRDSKHYYDYTDVTQYDILKPYKAELKFRQISEKEKEQLMSKMKILSDCEELNERGSDYYQEDYKHNLGFYGLHRIGPGPSIFYDPKEDFFGVHELGNYYDRDETKEELLSLIAEERKKNPFGFERILGSLKNLPDIVEEYQDRAKRKAFVDKLTEPVMFRITAVPLEEASHQDILSEFIFPLEKKSEFYLNDVWNMSHQTSYQSISSEIPMIYTIEILSNTPMELYKYVEITGDGGIFANTLFTSIDISNIDTSAITSFNRLFEKNSFLKEINLTGIKTSRLETMNNTFLRCYNLRHIKGFNTLDTHNLKEVNDTFTLAISLVELDVTGWKPENLDTMSSTFDTCLNLREIKGMADLKTPKLRQMSSTFKKCLSLREINMQNWIADELRYLPHTFEDCRAEIIRLPDFRNNKHLELLTGTFEGCLNLRRIENIETLTLEENLEGKACDVENMFNNCRLKGELNLSNMNIMNTYHFQEIMGAVSYIKKLNITGWLEKQYMSLEQLEEFKLITNTKLETSTDNRNTYYSSLEAEIEKLQKHLLDKTCLVNKHNKLILIPRGTKFIHNQVKYLEQLSKGKNGRAKKKKAYQADNIFVHYDELLNSLWNKPKNPLKYIDEEDEIKTFFN